MAQSVKKWEVDVPAGHNSTPRMTSASRDESAVICSECRQWSSPDARFCGACGARLTPHAYTPKHLADRILSSRAALEGERKPLTVLFADVENFTGLAGGKDPEDVHFLMDEVFAILLAAVHRYEGTVNQFLGDGVMALFGAPVALEDHALRAVEAALEIQKQIAASAPRFRTRFGSAPVLRIGLNSGRVVVGKIGDDLRMDYTAQGDTVNLAARLQQIAEAGTVAIGPATYRLVAGSVECSRLGLHQIKGLVEPIEVFRPLHAFDRGEISAATGRGLSPFVGREDELGRLLAAFAEVSAGRPGTVVVTGEAGAGKSRLLLELRRRIDRPDLQWFVGHCVPYGRSTPYRPIIKSIRAAIGLHEGTSPLEAERALDALLAPLGDRRGEVAPVIQYLLGLRPSDAHLAPLSPADRRAAITRALDAVIEALERRGPLVLVWEDCQWIDPVSGEYLALAAQRVSPGPILFIFTYRSEESPRHVTRPTGEDVVLRPLTRPQAATLVARLAGSQLAPELIALAVDRAAGNPLFLEEVTRALMESKTTTIPPTVEALLRARIDELSPPRKAVLEAAAVIGQEFARAVLERLVEDPPDLAGTLREFVREGLLVAAEGAGEAFRFRQPLLQEVAYEGWLSHRRKALHLRVGETIEHMYADRLFEHLEKLARHFTRAEEWERAVRYQRAAGRKAVTLCANHAAIQRFGRALEMLDRLPEGSDRTIQSVDVRLELCSPHLQLGRLDDVMRLSREAEQLAKSLGDERRLADVYSQLSNYHYMKGEPDTAIEFGRMCLTMPAGTQEDSVPRFHRQYLGTCYHAVGRYHESTDILTEHIRALELGEDFTRVGPANLSYVSSCGWLAFTLAELGEFERAHEASARGHRVASTTGHAYVDAISSTFAGLVWHAQGELDRAVPILRRSLDTCLEHQLLVWRPLVGALLGHAYVLQGRVPHGLDLLGEAIGLTDRLHVLAYRALWTGRLAEALLVAGQIQKALDAARVAVDLAVQHKERGNHARALIVLGTAYLRFGPAGFEQARSCLERGLSEAEQLHMRPLAARCYDVLGRLASEEGDVATAGQLRETATTMRRGIGLAPWWEAMVNPPPGATERAPELRRSPRRSVSWPVSVDTGRRRLHLQTANLSARGAKVRSSEPLDVGAPAQLNFQRPDGRPFDVQAIVSRADVDGPVFTFDLPLDQEFGEASGSSQ